MSRTRARQLATCAAAMLVSSALSSPSRAIVDGTPPTLMKKFTVEGASTIIGNTVLGSHSSGRINDIDMRTASGFGPTQTQVIFKGAPADASLVAAYVFWSGSLDALDSPDNTATLLLPDGSTQTSLLADTCMSVTPTFVDNFPAYYCRADVTNLLSQHLATAADGTRTLNGTYNLLDFFVRPGNPRNPSDWTQGCNPDPSGAENPCQGAYGGWSMILVWSSPSATGVKDIAIYDGFLRADEICDIDFSTGTCLHPSSGVPAPFTLTGFAASDRSAQLSVFALEGDEWLGYPQQPFVQVEDFLKLNGEYLQDANQEPHNFFNSTIDPSSGGTSTLFSGVDIKTVTGQLPQLSGFPPAVTSVTLQPGSGDGVPDPGPDWQTQGEDNGELFYLGNVMLSVNALAPSFRNSTKKVDKTTAAPGDTLTYTLHVENDGTLPSEVVVKDSLPTGLTYVPGSTTMDGTSQPDANGISPLFGAGLNPGRLWPISIPGVGFKQFTDITFKATIQSSVASGQICNVGEVDASYSVPGGGTTTMPPLPLKTDPCTTIQVPDIRQPLMTATVPGTWPDVKPGDRMTYTVTIENRGAQTASGLSLAADLPPYVSLVPGSVRLPFGASDASSATGGANGTGHVQINSIAIPGNFGITLSFDVQIFDDAAFAAAGGTDGTALAIQATLSGPNVSPALAISDDPMTPLASDPTTVFVRFGVDLSKSQKTVTGDSNGIVAPGNRLSYTVRLTNSGQKTATASINDPLPSNLTNCQVVSGPIRCVAQPDGTIAVTGANISLAGGASTDVTFTADVSLNAPDGAQITNIATLSAAERTGVTWQAKSPTVTVKSQVTLASTKSVTDVNGGGIDPGDVLLYTITLTNTGNRTSGAAAIKDPLDPNLVFQSASDGGFLSGGTVLWNSTTTPALGSLLPSQQVTVTFQARINPNATNGTTISNAAVSATPEASVTSNSVVVKVIAAPSFVDSTKTVVDESGSSTVKPGDLLDWNISVKNTGRASATNVVVTDQIDSNLDIVRVSGGGISSGNVVTWNIPTVAAGQTLATLTVVTRVHSPLANGTTISNQANIKSSEVPNAVGTDDPSTATKGDPTVVKVTSSVSLATTQKTVLDNDNTTDHLPGDKLTWHIKVIATGDSPAQNVSVTDDIQRCLNAASVVPGNGGIFDGTRVRWNSTTTSALTNVVPGTPVDLSFTATVAAGTPNGTLCANQAFLTSPSITSPPSTPSDDPSTPAAGDPTTILITSKPVLTASTKVAQLVDDNNNDGAISPGDKIRYTLTVNNTGSETAQGVTVSDTLSNLLTSIVLSSGGTLSGATATWSLGDIAARSNKVLTVDALVQKPLDDGTIIDNQAVIRATNVPAPALTDDPNTPVLNDPTRIVLKSAPILTMSKVVKNLGGTRYEPGDAIEYTLALQNSGTSLARNVRISDPLDANLTFVSASAGGTFDSVTRTVSFPTIASLDLTTPRTFTIDAKIAPALDNGTKIPNQAQAISQELTTPQLSDDPSTPVASDPTTIVVISAPDLSASTKTFVDRNGGDIRPGDIIDYTITVKNTGNAIAKSLRIEDPLDARLTPVSPIEQGGTFANGTVVWTPALTLAPGESATFRLATKLALPMPDGTLISNQAKLFAQDVSTPFLTDDPTTGAPSDPTTFKVKSAPSLAATKTVSDATRTGTEVHPGDELDWKIVARNTGDAEATNGTFTDTLDPNLDFISATGGGTFDASTRQITWTVPRIGISPDDLLLTVASRVKRPLGDGTVIGNQAKLSVAELGTPTLTDDPTTPTPNDPTRVTITARPDLSKSTKVAVDLNGGDFEPNDVVEYDITVKDTGDNAASNVTVTDAIDPLLTNVQALDGGTFDSAARTLSWHLPSVDLSPAGDKVVRFRATIAPLLPNGTKISNQASIASDRTATVSTDDPSTPLAGDPTIISVVSSPQLQHSTKIVVDNAPGGLVRPGDALTYTLVIKNTGNTFATDVAVEDPIDPQLTNVQPDQGGIFSLGKIRWDKTTTPALARLTPDGTGVTLTFRATIAADTRNGATILNQANVASAEGVRAVTDDPGTPSLGDPTAITTRFPDLTKTVKTVLDENGGDVEPGDWLTYTIHLTNTGTQAATNVSVEDPVDASLVDVAAGVGGTLNSNKAVWTPSTMPALAQLGPGQSVDLTLRGRVRALTPNGTVISNQATVKASELLIPVLTDADPTTPTPEPTKVTVVSHPKLETSTLAVSDARGTEVRPGDKLTYTLTVRNSGNAAGTHAIVTLTAPPELTNLKLDTPGQMNGQSIRWDESSLPQLASVVPGTDPVMVFEATVKAPLANDTLISLQGMIKVDEISTEVPTDDPSTPVLGDPTIVRVFSAPRFVHSEKTITDINGGQFEPGDEALYEIDVINDGTEPATGTMLVDTVPAGTTYEPGTFTMNGLRVDDHGTFPLTNGMLVKSKSADAAPGVVIVQDGQVPDAAAVLTFKVRLSRTLVVGTSISNQASITSDRTTAQYTDDPTTPMQGDPTVAVVGGGPSLDGARLSWKLVEDRGQPGVVNPGDVVEMDIEVPNNGDAAVGCLVSALPLDGLFQPEGDLTLDGASLTATTDGDAGEWANDATGAATASVRLGSLAPRSMKTVTLRARAKAGGQGVATAQARISCPGGSEQLTDSDPSLPGNQAARIPVTNGASGTSDLRASSKVVEDLNGGEVEPGDVLRYRLTIENDGPSAATNLVVTDVLPTGLTYVASSVHGDAGMTVDGQVVQGISTVTAQIASLGSGQRLQMSFLATIDAKTPMGKPIANTAQISGGSLPEPLTIGPATVTVGGITGTGAVVGKVYEDLDDSGSYSPKDWTANGFQVQVYSAATNGTDSPTLVKSVFTSADGDYSLVSLPPGNYELEFRAPDGTLWKRLAVASLQAGETRTTDAVIAPTGTVYTPTDFAPAVGARTYLFYDDDMVGKSPPACDEDQSIIQTTLDPALGKTLPRRVGERCLLEGQQGQHTLDSGAYRFDLPEVSDAVDYQIWVAPSSSILTFPSATHPPEKGFAPAGKVGKGHRPVHGAKLDPYYTELRSTGHADEVSANHIPLESLQEAVRITKQASRASVHVGEFVTYTVAVVNGSSQDMLKSGASGGLTVVDEFPEHLRYVRGSARALRRTALKDVCADVAGGNDSNCRQGAIEPEGALEGGGGVGRFGPYDVKSGETLILRYTLAVTGGAKPGDYDNLAHAEFNGVRITQDAKATIRVLYDSIFDESSVIGKVFCDDDGNQIQTPGEIGLGNARIYSDTGLFVDADPEGKFHFMGLKPGLHLFKLDESSLPPGSTAGDGVRQSYYLTAGLDARLNFPVKCHWPESKPDRVQVLRDKPKAPPPPPVPSTPPVVVSGSTQGVLLAFDAVPFQVARGDVRLELGDAAHDEASNAAVRDGRLPEQLVFRVLLQEGPAPQEWSFAIRDEKGNVLNQQTGNGVPPPLLSWNGKSADGQTKLARGGRYLYRLTLTTADGTWQSPEQAFGLDWSDPKSGRVTTPARPPPLASVLTGPLFGERDAQPKGALISALTALVSKLPKTNDSILVDVYADPADGKLAQKLTDARAKAIRDLLTAQGVDSARIHAVGHGASDPVVVVPGNVKGKQKKKALAEAKARNRRVSIVAELPVPETPPVAVPQPSAKPAVWVGGKPVAVGADGNFQTTVQPEKLPVSTKMVAASGAVIDAMWKPEITSAPAQNVVVQVDGARGLVSVGGVDVLAPMLAADVRLSGGAIIELGDVGPKTPLRFSIDGAAAATEWQLVVRDASNQIVKEMGGKGAPPPEPGWDGAGANGISALKPGTYTYQLFLTDGLGNRLQSARKTALAFVPPTPIDEVLPASMLFANDKTDKVKPAARSRLKLLAKRLATAQGSIVVAGHSDSDITLALTAKRAEAVKALLISFGVPANRLSAVGRGASSPLVPNIGARERAKNRRIEVRTAQPLPLLPATSSTTSLKIAGLVAGQTGPGRYAATIPQITGPFDVELDSTSGRSVRYRIYPPTNVQSAKPGAMNILPSGPLLAQAGNDLPPIPDADFMPPLPPDDVPPPPPPADSKPSPQASSAPVKAEPVTTKPAAPNPSSVTDVNGNQMLVAMSPDDAPPDVLAGKLLVRLPADHSVLRSTRLFIRGLTDAKNELKINGQKVEVDSGGRFWSTLDLASGDAKVTIETKDAKGNRAILERTYKVDPTGLFLMGIADASAGTIGGELAGTDTVDLKVGGVRRLFLGGRVAGTAVGQLDGKNYLGGFFKKLQLTANVDSTRRDDDSDFDDLLDPARYYPIWGDSANVVQLTPARGPVYVRLDADDSHALFGDFRTIFGDSELFRYDRTLYGGDVDFHRDWSPKVSTDLHLIGAPGDDRLRHGHVEIQATGGSIYYLQSGNVVEGSEHVRVVARDRDTGIEVSSQEKQRYTDYSISYVDGRLLFQQPVSAVSDATFLANTNTTSILSGNPVYVVVDYEYRDTTGDEGGTLGGYTQESFFGGLLSVGGGMVQESRGSASPYRLIGAEIATKKTDRTFAKLEFGRSNGTDANSFYSSDGGLTYTTLGDQCLTPTDPACKASGNAWKFEADGELADFLHRKDELLSGRLYFQDLGRGYFANGALVEQGTTKFGGELKYPITKKDVVLLRHDSVASLVDNDLAKDGLQPKTVTRRVSGLQYKHTEDRWGAVAEYDDVITEDTTVKDALPMDMVVVGGNYKPIPKLNLTLAQQGTLRGDPQLLPTWTDRLTTSLGAEYQLSKTLSATGTEAVRWDGENATQLGLTQKTGDSSQLYLTDRLASAAGLLTNTTLVGGSAEPWKGTRAYGEYQLDNAMSGNQNRAVLGLENKWTLRPGMLLSAGYERSQVIGNGSGPLAFGGVSGGTQGIVGAAPGATQGDILGVPPFGAPGMNPSTAISPGATSRDVASLAFEYLAKKNLKASAQLQARYDNADERFAKTIPGIADRLQLMLLSTVDWKWTDDVAFISRIVYADDYTLDARNSLPWLGKDSTLDARYLEATAGLALRPVQYDWFAMLAKISRVVDRRPVDLVSKSWDMQTADVLSIAPSFETPYKLGIAEKVAVKHVLSQVTGVPDETSWLVLNVNRLDYHVLPKMDLSLEYRFLWTVIANKPGQSKDVKTSQGDLQHGAAFEVAYRPMPFVRLGAGYNFASFSDNELSRLDEYAGGFFIRATGQY